MKLCSIDGCMNPSRKRGWCANHYSRWLRNGDVNEIRGVQPGVRRATFDSLALIETDECVLWPHRLDAHGYVVLSIKGKDRKAHALVCESRHGPRPTPRHEVAHSCGARACLNYRHLRWATRKENSDDRHLHGTAPTGENNPRHKLTADDVRTIRTLTHIRHTELAATYGVTPTTIYQIRNRQTWRNVA